jgi:hypothetical protein
VQVPWRSDPELSGFCEGDAPEENPVVACGLPGLITPFCASTAARIECTIEQVEVDDRRDARDNLAESVRSVEARESSVATLQSSGQCPNGACTQSRLARYHALDGRPGRGDIWGR